LQEEDAETNAQALHAEVKDRKIKSGMGHNVDVLSTDLTLSFSPGIPSFKSGTSSSYPYALEY
jgi:hypothetical protein